MDLTSLEKLKGSNRGKKRIGRGIGCGKGGHTVGRGNKGQKARKGSNKPWLGFEGGQVPLYKRLPRMRGFTVKGKAVIIAVSLSLLNEFKNGAEVTPVSLWQKKLIRTLPKGGVKLLANGDLKKKLTIKGFFTSEAALKKIEKAGSKVIK